MFNTRIIFGTIATAGLFAAAAATPAMATTTAGHPKNDHGTKTISVAGLGTAVTSPVTGLGGTPVTSPVTGSISGPISRIIGCLVASGAGKGLLGSLPLLGPLLVGDNGFGGCLSDALLGGAGASPVGGNPLGGALNGVAGALGGGTSNPLSGVTGALGGETSNPLSGVAGALNNVVPGLGQATGGLGSALGGLSGTLGGLVGLGGLTKGVTGLGSPTGGLPGHGA